MADHMMNDVSDKYPGKMAVAEARGMYNGCRVKVFAAGTVTALEESINEFFEENAGLLVVDLKWAYNDGVASAMLTYTSQVTPEYMQAIARYDQEIQAKLAEEKAQQLEAEAEAAVRIEDAQQKVAALAEVGRKCEEHHRPLIEKVRKLEAEVSRLRKGETGKKR